MIKGTKYTESKEQNMNFLWNKKILNLHCRWHTLWSQCFVAEVKFNVNGTRKKFKKYFSYNWNQQMLTIVKFLNIKLISFPFFLFYLFAFTFVKVLRSKKKSHFALTHWNFVKLDTRYFGLIITSNSEADVRWCTSK